MDAGTSRARNASDPPRKLATVQAAQLPEHAWKELQVTETTSGHSDPTSPRPSRFGTARRRWDRWGTSLLVLLAVAIVAYTLGRHSSEHELDGYKSENVQLRGENKTLKEEKENQKQQISDLNNKLKSVQDQLNGLFHPERTFALSPNEARMISSGHFSVGLIGPPTPDKVTINVNGKQQSSAAGDVIEVAFSTTCRVEVKSFEMFKAEITTICAEVKP
jgi:hypothetical protein